MNQPSGHAESGPAVVSDLLRRNATRNPDRAALVEVDSHVVRGVSGPDGAASGRSLTWREFDEAADKVAGYLIDRGIGPGSAVGIMMRNRLEWIPIYFGILRSGAVAVPLNFRDKSDDICGKAERVGIRALVFGCYASCEVAVARWTLSPQTDFVFVGEEKSRPG
ncbi:MAG TPA: class I adenylate-forming enzyme family protein, partial [Thermomicrobiales bacterium]|nr:class I adenylate-forming enzyme family protein [Thermomicrobiales bacterium]